MKHSKCRLLFCFVFACLYLLSACASPAANPTTQAVTQTDETENESAVSGTGDPSLETEELGEGEKYAIEAELLDDITCLVSYGDSGLLTLNDTCNTVTVTAAKDLAPYRQYLPDLTAELEKTILADKEGKCLLVEICAKSEYHSCDITSVFRDAGKIEILLSEFLEEEIQPTHTFFLFYLPAEIYNGEELSVVFLEN